MIMMMIRITSITRPHGHGNGKDSDYNGGDGDDDDDKDGSLCFNDERQKEFYNGMKKPNIKHKLCSNYICTGNIFIVMCKTLKVQVLTP